MISRILIPGLGNKGPDYSSYVSPIQDRTRTDSGPDTHDQCNSLSFKDIKDLSILQAYDHGKYEIEASPFCKEDKLTIGEDVYGLGYKIMCPLGIKNTR